MVGAGTGGGRPLPSGKLPLELLTRLLEQLPDPPAELLLGARIGEDACAIEVPAGVLVAAADPITLTSEDAARLSVVVNANDVAVTGAVPRWFLAVVLVPPGTGEEVVQRLFAGLGAATAELGVHLVGGHTETTPAVNRPVVVGQMLGLAARGGVVTTGGLEPGDVVLQVRPAPIEGAAVLARDAWSQLAGLDEATLAAARAALDDPGVSVVEPALLAAELGARALHDPTEGGLAGGLHELALAAGVSIRVDREAVLWFEPGLAVCRAVGADPWSTLASGTLLAAFAPDLAEPALTALRQAGHRAARLGLAERGAGVSDETGEPIPWPDRDEVARLLGG
ncbi:MAG TPA: AIR synthase related protein [Gaiellaceae bacterium]|nr:AIR synthase related protein [Gaiellaceae bacterium]